MKRVLLLALAAVATVLGALILTGDTALAQQPTVAKNPPAGTTVVAGTNLTYTITITNNQPVFAIHVNLSDALPLNTTFVSLTAPAGFTCTTPPVGTNGTVTCGPPSGTVNALATATFTLVVAVSAATPNGTVLTNTASFTSPDTFIFCSPIAPCSGSTTTIVLQPTPTPTNTATPTPTSTATPTPTSTPTATNTPTNTATATATNTATATATNTATPTPTSTATPTPTSTPTATNTPTNTATATATNIATATSTPDPLLCQGIGAICHADLTKVPNADTLTGAQFLWASGPIMPGPCVPTDKTNCVETVNTGSFTVRSTLVTLLAGDTPLIRIPVVNGAGAPAGSRDLNCPTAGGAGISVCPGFIADPGFAPLCRAIVLVFLTRPTSLPVPPVVLPTSVVPIVPLLPPPHPIPVLIPPPPLVPLPLLPAPAIGAAPVPEVPLIPETDTALLILTGLVGLGVIAVWRRR